MLRLVPIAAPVDGASWRQRASLRLSDLLHRALHALGVPGAIKPMSYRDAVSGHEISVHVGVLFTRLSIDGRDFYFRRLTGDFDGTGSGCGTCH